MLDWVDARAVPPAAPPGFALTLTRAPHHALFTGPTLVREVAPALGRFNVSLTG